MPKDAAPYQSLSFSATSSVMLSLENLSKHTQYHKELNVKRDFLKEFLDALGQAAAPEHDPAQETTEAAESTEEGSPTHRNAVSRSSDHHPQPYHQQALKKIHRNESKQEEPSDKHEYSHKTIAVPSSPEPSRKKNEKQQKQGDRLSLIECMKRKSGSKSIKRNEPKMYKRRKQLDNAAEHDIQHLDTTKSEHNPPSKQEKGKIAVSRTAGTNGSGSRSMKKVAIWNHRAQEDRHGTKSQDKGSSREGRNRRPLQGRENDDHRNYHEHHKRHHTKGKEHSITTRRPRTSDSNKPRKVLTQGSLVMNMLDKSTRLGIFKKGKASQRTTVNAGNGFLEEAFLNQRADSGIRDDNRRGKIVTSTYFDQQSISQTDDQSDMDSPSADGSDTHSAHSLKPRMRNRVRSCSVRREKVIRRSSVNDMSVQSTSSPDLPKSGLGRLSERNGSDELPVSCDSSPAPSEELVLKGLSRRNELAKYCEEYVDHDKS
ncbi:hypothetical protein BG011_009369 [Mortierella polycephala]|uniref:Uncharacterized protein n=1 Tax=Mortierella polycephala TaxID=41804 RepID=A0A9P6PPD3_9FUNG|nr:hypothetical protein BG011_009369 [Mortierella polycephala]